MTEKSETKKPDEIVVREPQLPVSNDPDEHTRKDKVFFPGGAPNQVFQLNLGFVSYGTDDKSHAASLILSIMLGALMLALFVIGAFVDRVWISDGLKILGPAFTLVAGVAIGKSTSSK